MEFLKQSTACTIMFGPFVDKTDAVTLKTDATTITDIDHASTGIFLSKAGATAAIRHATVTASVADAYGMMKVTLDTTDTNTVGRLDVLFAKAATYLPVHKHFFVLPAAIYDWLTAGAAPLTPTTAGRTLDVSTTGEAGVDWANVGSPTTTLALTGTTIAVTQKVDVDTIKTNPVVNGGTITFPTTATLASTTNITAGTIATVTTLTNLPAITSNWLTAAGINASALNGKGDWNVGKTGYALSSAGIQALWDALTSALTTVGSIGKKLADWVIGTTQTGDAYARLGAPAGASVSADIAAVKADTAAVKAKTDNLPTDPADESLIIAATDAIMARLGSPAGASQSADIAAVKADTAAIKVVTDDLATPVEIAAAVDAAVVNVNIYAVNDEVITGTGIEDTDEWRPV